MLRRSLTLSLNLFSLILLGMVSAQMLSGQRTEAQGVQGFSYSRFLDDPAEKYSFDALQRAVSDIRSQGHGMPVGHPRIFLRPANREALRQKIAANYKDWMQEAVNLADANFGVRLTGPRAGEWGLRKEHPAQPVVLAEALTHQLGRIAGVTYKHTPEEYGRDGVEHLMDLLPSTYDEVPYLALPLGYDWLFDLLSEQERRTVASKLLELAQPESALGDKQFYQGYGNQPPGAQLLGALATYGDDAYVARADVQRTLDLLYDGMIFGDNKYPLIFKFTFSLIGITTPEGPGTQGLGYSEKYQFLYPFLLAWRDQTGEDYFQLPFFQHWPLYFLHSTGNEYEHQMSFANSRRHAWEQGAGTYQIDNAFFELGLQSLNPRLASLMKYHYQRGGMTMAPLSWRYLYMLLADPSLPAQSPEELKLPLSEHFQSVNHIFSRNSWKGTDAMWLLFTAPTWNNRGIGPLNDFLLWKNGGFLLTMLHQAHEYFAPGRTNTLARYDTGKPGVTFTGQNEIDDSIAYDLGVRLNDPDSTLRSIRPGIFGYHQALRYAEDTPDYLYAFGDGDQTLLGSKGSPTDPLYTRYTQDTLSLPGWTRQLLLFHPEQAGQADHIIVLDRTEGLTSGIQEHLLFNFTMQPSIRDRSSNGDLGSGEQVRDGIWKYANASRIVATNTVTTDWGTAHGRAFLDTLLPKNPVYLRMGGIAPLDRPLENTRNIDLFGALRQDRLEAWGSPDDPENILRGMWRVQVTSEVVSTSERTYLHVIQATDSSVNQPDPTQLLEGPGLTGARVGGDIALFNPVEGELVNGSLTIPSGISGTFRVLLADLTPDAAYIVTIGTTTFSRSAGTTGTLFLGNLSLTSGTRITVQKSASSSDGTPPVLRDISVGSVTDTMVTIKWTTDERSDSQVEYGTTTSYGTLSPIQSARVISHSVTLTGLSPSTSYHFRARSKDAAGNLGISSDALFTTAAGSGGGAPPPPPPPAGPEPVPPPPRSSEPGTPPPELFGEWTFDEGTGTLARDISGHNHHGTLLGPQWATQGRILLDGIDDLVDLGKEVSMTGPVTVSAWIKASVFPRSSFETIIGNASCNGCSNYTFDVTGEAFYDGNSLANQRLHFSGVTGRTVLSANRWYHVAATRSGSTGNWTLTLYVNGAVDGSFPSAANPYGGNLPTEIGNYPTLSKNFSGVLDDVCLFSRALTSAEINRLFNGGSGRNCVDLYVPSSEELCLSPRPENRVRLASQDFSGLPVTLTITDPQGLLIYSGIHTPTNKEGEIRITDPAILAKITDATLYTLTARPESHRRRKMTLLGSALKASPCDLFPSSPFGFLDESGPITIQHLVRLIAHYRTQSDAQVNRAFLSQKFTLRDLVSVIKLYVSKTGQE